VGKKIANASAIDDSNVFGKVGTTGAAVEAALKGKTVRRADSGIPVHDN
jgi:formamidopyrimidine-DNA glycosylase